MYLRFFTISMVLAAAVALGVLTHPVAAAAARLFLNPGDSTAAVGSTFVTDVVVATEGELVNAVAVELQYPISHLDLRDAQLAGVAFPLAPVAPRIDRSTGSVKFEAGAPGGFRGQTEVLRLTWQVKQVGSVAVTFGPGSQLLRHSATADSVPLTPATASFQLVARDARLPVVTSKDHPDEAMWYNVPFVRMAWEVALNTKYSYVLSRLPNEEPDEVPDEPVGEIKLATPDDGVFYFHLRECRGGVCGPTASRRVMKDTVPPEPFSILLGQAAEAFQGKRFVSFSTTDTVSGIDRYEVAEGGDGLGTWSVVASPYVLREQGGEVLVTVRAYDRAGNVREVTLDVPAAQQRDTWQLVIVVGLALAVLLLLVHRRRRKRPSAVTP